MNGKQPEILCGKSGGERRGNGGISLVSADEEAVAALSCVSEERWVEAVFQHVLRRTA